MRMQIYEHIYDLFPPIHTTTQMVNNLFLERVEEKGARECMKIYLTRFENLIHFSRTRKPTTTTPSTTLSLIGVYESRKRLAESSI